MTEHITDMDAALAEGLAPMPDDLIPLRNEKLMLDEQIEQLTNRKKEITDTFGKRLGDEGLQGFLLNGKVHARKSNVTNTRVDAKKLKTEMPHVYGKYMVITKSTRVTVN